MARTDKKQRHKAKRESKRKQARRLQAISPLKRLADAPGEIEFWMSDNFSFMGQVQIFAFKRGAGLSGIACFLVDKGVVGLKDAWAQINIERARFEEILESCEQRGFPMRRVMPDTARRMIAGGIRWAHDNGMRLPRDWAKTASVIGGVGDWASADVSKFEKEFSGHPEDLRQRLIGEPFDTYIRRTDIRFLFSDAAPYMDQETGEYVDADDFADDEFDSHYPENRLDALDEDLDEEFEAFANNFGSEALDLLQESVTPAAIELAADTAGWLTANGRTPSPELVEAYRSLLLSVILPRMAEPDMYVGELVDLADLVLDGLGQRMESRRIPEYENALKQGFERLDADRTMLENAIRKSIPALVQSLREESGSPLRLPSADS